MAQRDKNNQGGRFTARVQFAGLQRGETPPGIAVYEVDTLGRAVRKLAEVRDGQLDVQPDWEKAAGIALGPDTDDVSALGSETLVPYRFDTISPVWRESGIIIGRNLWERFLFEFVCVTSTA